MVDSQRDAFVNLRCCLTNRSSKNSTSILLLLLVFFPLLAGCALGQQQSQEQNGLGEQIRIADQFDAFYKQNGGSRIFGYPVAEAYADGDKLVQYFQRMRLEYVPAQNHLIISPLGLWAVPDPVSQIPAPVTLEAGSRFFEGTELSVQDEFLSFYEENGGDLLFGLPISAQLDEGGKRVQYFQNARLEWHPEAPLDYRVQLGYLGEAHYREQGIYEDPVHGQPIPSFGIREAEISANVRTPIQYSGDDQIIFVDVVTQNGRRPIQSVLVQVTALYDNKVATIDLPVTDGLGHTQGELVLPDVTPGQKVQTIVNAYAPGDEFIGSTSLSYTIWW
jgi:hypothetical protein